MVQLQVRRLGFALGAAITGLDLRRAQDDATIAAVRQAWLEHLLLCFPGQNLSKDELVAFAGRFGELERWRKFGTAPVDRDDNLYSKTCDPDNPYVNFLTNKPIAGRPWDGYKEGLSWHSDRSSATRPTLAPFLLAREIPEVGGDTMFANQYMAYETLSPTMRGIAEQLSAVHDRATGYAADRQASSVQAATRDAFPPVVHPVVTLHPETERKALFVGDDVRRFVGMTDEESKPLLAFLNHHAVSYEFTYRHRWRRHDLVMWDNRCLMHQAVKDYDMYRQPRDMIRVSLRAPESGYVYVPNDEAADPDEREPNLGAIS